MPGALQILHPEDGLFRLHVGSFENVGKLPADHQPHNLVLAQLFGGLDRDQLAVAQDGHPVAQPLDLVEAVRDVDDGHALVPQAAHQGKELVHLFVGQRRGRLVQGQHPHARFQRAHNFHQLPLRRRQLIPPEMDR